MKRGLIVLITLVLAVGMVGAAFASFDTGPVSNQTPTSFTAGNLHMVLGGTGSSSGDGVTGTWTSPPGWAPGDQVTGTITATNEGTVKADHIYFMFSNLQHTDGDADASNLMNAIIVTSITETFKNTNDASSVTTTNQVDTIASQVGDKTSPLTLAELAGWMTNSYGYYTVDDQSGDGVVLAAGDHNDYSISFTFEFDPNAGNMYENDSCSFDLTLQARQNSPTDGLVEMHQ